MATSLLRLGRLGSLKCLQLENWGVLTGRSAACLCTRAKEPAEPTKKTQAVKKPEAPEERSIFLAYKTTVTFPARLSESGVLPTHTVGVTGPVADTIRAAVVTTSEPIGAELEGAEAPAADPDVVQVITNTAPPVGDSVPPAVERLVHPSSKTSASGSTSDDAVSAAAASSEPGKPEADGSSSSDSDSDSDSEEEKTEVKTETKTSPPPVSESIPKEAEVQENTSGMKEDPNEATVEVRPGPKSVLSFAAEVAQEAFPAAEEAQATIKVPSIGSEKLVKPAPKIGTATKDVGPEASAEAIVESALKVTEDRASSATEYQVKCPSSSNKAQKDAPVETPKSASALTPREVAAANVSAPVESTEELENPAPLIADAEAVPLEAEAAVEVSAPVGKSEELVDPAPVIAEAGGEEQQASAPVKPSEEAAAVAPPEPDEPFDNSTYKNYQHHNYNPYTFSDLDVEMAKFRLPQPSSLRH
ncbi:fibrous sheath CABYR-binding protein isoform X2 [Pungitius pungitius]|uniref:fibrous sheath CABYR-binding protein isoform X2 n=1 Tax=Pungitius pungitius TaxID=134920 RepID=UPI001887CD09|nr:fibrous sheath CABYR-binding protein isoform X2 [Pungitius pungitius]